MFQGFLHFLNAIKLVLTHSTCRKWFLGQVLWSLFIGTGLLIGVSVILKFSLDAMMGWALTFISSISWLAFIGGWAGADAATETLEWLILAIVLFFSAGPMMLILSTIFLSIFGRWQKLKTALPFSTPQMEAPFEWKRIIKEIVLSLLLVGVVLMATILGFFGPLLIFSILLSSFAVGREWAQTGDSQFSESESRPVGFLYAVGLGVLPTLIASIPIVGVLVIPILQIASLLRYRQA